mmetsp:Transcript_94763/g.267532  ORF Transcript_94763/g.267532 Transcript_94763/m.267532 type:complete len:228 (+) Transcript_94763:1388-2071(+)
MVTAFRRMTNTMHVSTVLFLYAVSWKTPMWNCSEMTPETTFAILSSFFPFDSLAIMCVAICKECLTWPFGDVQSGTLDNSLPSIDSSNLSCRPCCFGEIDDETQTCFESAHAQGGKSFLFGSHCGSSTCWTTTLTLYRSANVPTPLLTDSTFQSWRSPSSGRGTPLSPLPPLLVLLAWSLAHCICKCSYSARIRASEGQMPWHAASDMTCLPSHEGRGCGMVAQAGT